MAIQVQPDDRRRRRSSARNYLQTECVRWRRPSGRRVPRATVRRQNHPAGVANLIFSSPLFFRELYSLAKDTLVRTLTNISSSRIDKRLRLSRSTLRPQLTAERSSHWDTAMLRGGGDNTNMRISIESHKDGCYENNQLTPAFNSLTAVYNNTQCCHRNTAMYRESFMYHYLPW